MDAYKHLAQVILDAPDGGLAVDGDVLLTVRDGVLTKVSSPVAATRAVTTSTVLSNTDDGDTLVLSNAVVLTIPSGLILNRGIRLIGATPTAGYAVLPSAGTTLNGAAILINSPIGVKSSFMSRSGTNAYLFAFG